MSHLISTRKTVPKTVESAWTMGLAALLIIKIFEKIVEGFFLQDQIVLLISFSTLAFVYAISVAGVLQRAKWGVGLTIVITVLDILVASYNGESTGAASVLLGLGVLFASYSVFKYSFDK